MLQPQLRVVSLNCEGHHHLDLILPFLRNQQADVYCLQEVFASDLPALQATWQGQIFFQPMANIRKENQYRIHPFGHWGVAIGTRLPIIQYEKAYYAGDDSVPDLVDGQPNSVHRVLQWLTVEKETVSFTIANTHFTWSSDGNATPEQRRDQAALLNITKTIGEGVFFGDFNAPRGREIFAKFLEHYKDNIPPTITTTLDNQFHRAKNLQLVVDGCFSTPEYTVTHVEVGQGVSDHLPIIANIIKGS